MESFGNLIFIWFMDNLAAIFWGLTAWIFFSFSLAFAYYCVRRSYIQRHPMPWEGREWENQTTGNLTNRRPN